MIEKSETPLFFLQAGTVLGSKHRRLNLNNQDVFVEQSFIVPAFKRQYYIGLVADGCTNNPLFSHNEVGANLLALYAYKRIQELICSGVSVELIPTVLFSSCTEFLWDLMNRVMPSTIVWTFPAPIKDRENWSSRDRFRNDYLAATLLGFIADDEKLVFFTAGDGILLENDELEMIDQNNLPDYPAISVNQPGKGFTVKTYPLIEVERAAIMTDGFKPLLEKEPSFLPRLFEHETRNPLGLQIMLNLAAEKYAHLMKDDCTVVVLKKIIKEGG